MKPPRLANSPVQLECSLLKIVEVEETGLILGRVVLVHAKDEVVSDGRLVVEANNQGIPFVLADPTARVSQDLARMAQALTAPTGTAPPALLAVGRR